MNKQEKESNKNSRTRTTVGWVPEGRALRGYSRVNRVKYMAMEEDLTFGGKHTIQYTDDESCK